MTAMALEIQRTDGGCHVRVTGDLTIFQVADYHARLLAGCGDAGSVSVDLGATDELDGAGLQLLLALDRQLAGSGGGLVLTALSEAAGASLEAFGLRARFAPAQEAG